MKIRCVKNNLEKIIQQAENFVGKNLDLEVLSCIILEVKDGYLKINSTNIDTAFSAEIPVVMEQEGRIAVVGDIFYKTISAIQDGEISLEQTTENKLHISSKSSKVDLNILPHEDFPALLNNEGQNEEELERKITVNTQDFLEGMNNTFYAASKSNIKPELSSICISGSEDVISFAATDGFRLSEKKNKFVDEDNSDFLFLIPSESIAPIIKTLSIEEEKDLQIWVYKNQVFFKNSRSTIFSRLTEGDYVDYKRLIPEDTTTSVIVLKQDFLNSLRLINIFSDDFNQIKISVLEKEFILETSNTYGKNKTKVSAAIVGEDLEMKFNYKYIQDAFTSIKTDSIEFIFNPGRPMLMKPVGDNSFKYIVMPLSR